MHCHQINIHKSSRTARSYNPMLHVVTRLHLHTFSLLFKPRFSCSDEQDVIVFSKSKPLFTRDSPKAWQDCMCYVCLCIQKIVLGVNTCAGKSSCPCRGHAPTQTINQWALELRGYAAHIPCLLQGNKDALFPAQKYTNTAGPEVLYSNCIQ